MAGPSGHPSEFRSVAVLPLRPLGTDRDEILELGIADTLIARLSRFPTLEVRSIGAVRRYAGPEQDALRAGRELQVDAVLEGTLQRAGNAIRVNLQLLDTRNGRAAWTGTFHERSPDLFRIEDGIAERVAPALALELTRERRKLLVQRPTAHPEAYRHYLEGRYFFSRRSDQDFRKAIQRFEEAIRLDPGYAEAHAALAEALLIHPGYGPMAQRDVIGRVQQHAARAIELDPAMGEPHRVLALVAENYTYDRRKAEDEYRLALELAPKDATSHHYYGEMLALMGRFEEAEGEMRIAYRLDPLSLILQADWAQIADFARNYDLAIERANKILQIEPRFEKAHSVLAFALYSRGDCEEANAALDRSGLELTLLGTARYHLRAGNRPKALQSLSEIERRARTEYVNPTELSKLYAALGQLDRAIDLLERVAANGECWGIIGLEVDPHFDPLRGHPRFQALLARLGAVEPEVVKQAVRLARR